MSQSTLADFMKEYKQKIEQKLRFYISSLDSPPVLKEAMDYSLQAGGKRIRPVLLFAAINSFGKDPERGMDAAAALEMIHTYSLIHDDLPSMDDDDLRRGKPTNHKVYGEANAILAGDALLTYAFQIIAQSPDLYEKEKVAIIEQLAKAAGPEGMVAGQVADMEGEKKALTLEELEAVHRNKTGRLIAFSVRAGALIGGATEAELAIFEKYAYHIGIAFQIQDDILDIVGSEEKLGKRVGSDIANHKNTYPALLTVRGAREKLKEHVDQAIEELNRLDIETALLKDIALMIATRDS
ncbi:polyprenyl synthetase family protein [Bacillus smithii]|uniref:polyprenyl synthetase family protein n=1 Tax=Bacillus smithii TaxID=1479 RepID=UPI002E1DE466|nr:polyprenyl synthetase family protein [Bacillus smithii]MED1488937.1 polyprenyl synthetase family protein [Bacillus smithii]